MLFEQVTERSAPKKIGSKAMNTRLPYANAVPSGVATNLATVALTASVPFVSVAFKLSRAGEVSVGATDPWSTSAIFAVMSSVGKL